jgi:adenylate cyclase
VDADEHVHVMHWDRRGAGTGDFHPSRRLILEAVRQQQSVLHLWRGGGKGGQAAHGTRAYPEFTIAEQADWAFATPLTGEACRGWALFVAGRAARSSDRDPAYQLDPGALRDELKFAELVAGAVAAWRDNQKLRQRQAALKAFFSPQVLDAIGRDDPQQALAPRGADLSVIFCAGFHGRANKRPTLWSCSLVSAAHWGSSRGRFWTTEESSAIFTVTP